MSKILRRLLPLLVLAAIFQTSTFAQQPDRPPNLNLGDLVVTGFSGTIAPAPGKLPAGKSAIDLTFIDPDGASARVVDVSRPGQVWDDHVLNAPKKFDVYARDTGQVFGVALDDAAQPNIYLASSSAYGLYLAKRGRDGLPERVKKGGPGAGWMKGQFGLDLQGGPGTIYKVDGKTGAVTLFANVTLNGVPNPAPGLGNLAYDAAHKQLFVSDLYTGMIHRFDLDGKELGTFDHGVAALTAANLAPLAFDPKNRPNIASDRFDSEKPETWGYAPAKRQVWGLAVHSDRLFYAVASGPQIWSVGIARDGSFAPDPRWELDVPAQGGALPVSDIAFTRSGAMILAQRAPIAASYDYSAFTRPGEPRVLRFWLKDASDPPSPGRWKLEPQEYAVGYPGQYRNSNGGVALGYGYDENGAISTGACEASLWATGQNLRNNPALRSQLEPGGPLVVHGLQAVPTEAIRDVNAPPNASYFVAYDDAFTDPRAAGHAGSVRTYTKPCAEIAYYAPPPYWAPFFVATGTPNPRACTPTCSCPDGTEFKNGECLELRKCPPNMAWVNGKCVPHQSQSIMACQPPMIQIIGGPCVCPPGMNMVDGKCVAPTVCPPPFIQDPNTKACICPQGSVRKGRICVTQLCPSPMVASCGCPPGMIDRDGVCIVQKAQVGEIVFTKKTVYVGPILLPVQPYPIVVTCGSQVTTLNLMPDVPQSIGNIPYGTSCSYTEPTPPIAPGLCPPNMPGVWTTVFAPPAPVTVNAPTTSVTVTNTLTCQQGGGNTDDIDVSLAKTGGTTPACPVPYYDFMLTVTNNGNAYGGPNPVTVTDTVPNGLKFDSATGTNWTCTPLPASAGTTITCTYTGTPLTTGQVLPSITIGVTAQDPAPFPPYTNCADVMTSIGHNDANLSNNHACVTVAKPSSCPVGMPPPPPACNPPLVQVPGGPCACPQGTVLADGQCVPPPPPPICQPPMIPGPVKGECICGPGFKQRGKACVKELVCGEHALPNRAGTECMCAKGYMMKGGMCVRQNREEPKKREKGGITTDDALKVLPYVLPLIGGHGGSRGDPGGGGAGGRKGP
jgi:uncharacterized repeat protein (TIGR01451 family)